MARVAATPRGWRIHAVLERVLRGRGSELKWYEGHVFNTRLEQGQLRLRALFPDGYEDWWHGFPDRTFSFRKASSGDPRVSCRTLESSRRRFAC